MALSFLRSYIHKLPHPMSRASIVLSQISRNLSPRPSYTLSLNPPLSQMRLLLSLLLLTLGALHEFSAEHARTLAKLRSRKEPPLINLSAPIRGIHTV